MGGTHGTACCSTSAAPTGLTCKRRGWEGLDGPLVPLCGAGAVKEGAWHAHDAILEMLNLHEAGRARLGDGGQGSGGVTNGDSGKGNAQRVVRCTIMFDCLLGSSRVLHSSFSWFCTCRGWNWKAPACCRRRRRRQQGGGIVTAPDPARCCVIVGPVARLCMSCLYMSCKQ